MDIRKECIRVLNQNWREGFTVPSPHLYPFQWNWDSGFIALGYLHFDEEKAFQEMEYLFKGQWDNGFLPHIVFHNEDPNLANYFPSADYWNSAVSTHAPENLKTTGISQPPIHGYVLERLLERFGPSDRLARLFDQLVRYHAYLYQSRDTLGKGLVSVWHNWETGMDNSPWWDESIDRIEAEHLTHIQLQRQDIKAVANHTETRPTDDEYRRYLWMMETLQAHQYESCPADYPFQLLDHTFNSVLLASTRSLLRLAPSMGRELQWLQDKLDLGIATFNELLWSEESGCYFPVDLVSGEQVKLLGAASFLPLFAGIPDDRQAVKVKEALMQFSEPYGVPSFDPSHPAYEPKKYWRGPIWVNMNYMIWKGLLSYGFQDAAQSLKSQTIEMVERYGLREYYPVDVREDTAYGGVDFSWSASLALDMINT